MIRLFFNTLQFIRQYGSWRSFAVLLGLALVINYQPSLVDIDNPYTLFGYNIKKFYYLVYGIPDGFIRFNIYAFAIGAIFYRQKDEWTAFILKLGRLQLPFLIGALLVALINQVVSNIGWLQYNSAGSNMLHFIGVSLMIKLSTILRIVFLSQLFTVRHQLPIKWNVLTFFSLIITLDLIWGINIQSLKIFRLVDFYSYSREGSRWLQPAFWLDLPFTLLAEVFRYYFVIGLSLSLPKIPFLQKLMHSQKFASGWRKA